MNTKSSDDGRSSTNAKASGGNYPAQEIDGDNGKGGAGAGRKVRLKQHGSHGERKDDRRREAIVSQTERNGTEQNSCICESPKRRPARQWGCVRQGLRGIVAQAGPRALAMTKARRSGRLEAISQLYLCLRWNARGRAGSP